MELTIVQRISQYVAEKRTGIQGIRKEEIVQKNYRDSVTISQEGSDVKKVIDAIEQNAAKDIERQAKVQAIKEAVESGAYKMSAKMMDSIAERIAEALV
ncbi:MAG: hypothetical protein A2268_10060 [Candidatus Raymondbacteria bacterium RifOxyA12_full_50_37]|uniref:Anti-sigma-28 factor FlgM C-terminal domain-containing protein n=1 Tax=Candidatus Raymondbacteria bacterium RIFOXYD12_FULL_49_13 TaxID=1817890 RepID=A0A1F7F4C7_UNCRA|nr:MAG: hypothetical protein A2268_10060 [Candidatus Raymondbacteria bacterium RifOxyA12_full_50_37]OGJ92418.1 MAG: hypothetical protein A2350_03250 [Candidatus Raymondbacteria bacterium RifOxyB12_full_50_8]OGJ93818.1 MAG: hypothetical protein A2248_06240 [Candidatus Raymondbacteria bacterium RIFOXYA2_FULL_49_16]OGJ98315.1 MAG: hypothetical protein A2453_00935 [Candidatus Raymondbacteria bacterium RIFOXYC2_FULL_50_21]OGJ99253.1 MAG: hypothetical protein A2487_19570 [Candidatus Raymondbacteria b